MYTAVCGEVRAAEFFVATNGNNANAGSAAAPWRTLQYAAGRVGGGDRVTVRAGNYAGFELTVDGDPGDPIEFFAEPGVHITSAVPSRGDGINLEGASHVVIDGFNIANMPRSGVRSVGFSDEFATDVTIRNVTATNNGVWGIFTGHVNDLLIEDNRTSGSLDEHGIYVSNSGDGPVIRNNLIWGNNGSGIHMNGDLSQGGDGVISDAHVYGNIIFDNGFLGSGINMDGVQDSRIENNLIYDNHSSGISLYQIDAGEPARDNIVVNNTIHVAGDGRWALNIQDGSTGNTVRNNILLNDHASRGAIDISTNSLTGFTSDYNVVGPFGVDPNTPGPPFNRGGSFLSLANWRAQTGQDLHTVIAEPGDLFIDWQDGDYQLLATAAARNAGTPHFAPLLDLTGKPRPLGGAFDVGAYEFGLALAGDYNGDNVVDAADYTLWRNSFGSEGDGLPADGDGDGRIDEDDYGVWRENYGRSLSGGSGGIATPEPATFAAAILAMMLFGSLSSRRRI